MGVTMLQVYPIPEGKSGPQTIEMLTKRIVSLGGVQTGQFLVDCETYVSVPSLGPQRGLHVLHNSEQPATVFALSEWNGKTTALTTDLLFDLLLNKLSGLYTSKKTRMESKGPRFELHDFIIKLGSVSMSQNFKGILVEVEYLPCVLPVTCWDLMREFMQGFLGTSVSNNPPQFLQNRQSDLYQPTDTIHQYLDHFNAFRKATTTLLR